jgi:hypothetical protein
VFALEYPDHGGQPQRAYFFLEADRGTMPVIRKVLVQTSFFRKLLAYEATWTNKVHQRQLGITGLLSQGTVPWHKPWSVTTGLPRNLVTQKPYDNLQRFPSV